MLSKLPEVESAGLPALYVRRAKIVEQGFWKKLARLAGRVPFVEDLAAAYFCFIDPTTPGRVRGVVLVALAWFVLPASIFPEFIVVLGFTDDVAVVAVAARMVRRHIKERHYQRAREMLGILQPIADDEIWSGY
ncbi:MAG TPA: YkvA family protein [Rhizomicrobium sp.]